MIVPTQSTLQDVKIIDSLLERSFDSCVDKNVLVQIFLNTVPPNQRTSPIIVSTTRREYAIVAVTTAGGVALGGIAGGGVGIAAGASIGALIGIAGGPGGIAAGAAVGAGIGGIMGGAAGGAIGGKIAYDKGWKLIEKERERKLILPENVLRTPQFYTWKRKTIQRYTGVYEQLRDKIVALARTKLGNEFAPTCPITRDLILLPCQIKSHNHPEAFEYDALRQAIQMNPICPLCRKAVTIDDIQFDTRYVGRMLSVTQEILSDPSIKIDSSLKEGLKSMFQSCEQLAYTISHEEGVNAHHDVLNQTHDEEIAKKAGEIAQQRKITEFSTRFAVNSTHSDPSTALAHST